MRRWFQVLLASQTMWVALAIAWSLTGRLSAGPAEPVEPNSRGLLAQAKTVEPPPAPPKEDEESKKADADDEVKPAPKRPDVIFVPTPQEVVDAMLELAEVKKGDVLYDLGCGDGRIVVTAAKKYGVKATGFDVDPQRIKESRENVQKNGVGDLVKIKQDDIFQQDLTPASVVTLYLLPDLNVKLMPQLEKLKPGSRIVSHSFAMRGAKPKKSIRVKTRLGGERTVYLWVVPWEKEVAEAEDDRQVNFGR